MGSFKSAAAEIKDVWEGLMSRVKDWSGTGIELGKHKQVYILGQHSFQIGCHNFICNLFPIHLQWSQPQNKRAFWSSKPYPFSGIDSNKCARLSHSLVFVTSAVRRLIKLFKTEYKKYLKTKRNSYADRRMVFETRKLTIDGLDGTRIILNITQRIRTFEGR